MDKSSIKIRKSLYVYLGIPLVIALLWSITLDRFLLGLTLWGLLLVIASFFYTINSLEHLELKRFSRELVHSAGDTFEERFEIINRSRFPVYKLEMIDQSGIFTEINSQIINHLKAGEHLSLISQSYLYGRGYYSLGPIEFRTGDPFGLFEKRVSKDFHKFLMVYPFEKAIADLEIDSGRSTAGAHRFIRKSQSSPQAVTVREYLPGDSLNRVHWLISLKKNRMMVKEFEEDTQLGAWIFLDAEKGIYYSAHEIFPQAISRPLIPLSKKADLTLPRDSFEYAVSISASIARECIQNKIAVGFTSEAAEITNLPAESGKRQLGKIRRALAEIRNVGSIPLEIVLERQLKNIGKGSFIFLITANIGEKLEAYLQSIRQRGYHYRIYQLVNSSFQFAGEIPDIPYRNDVIPILFKNTPGIIG